MNKEEMFSFNQKVTRAYILALSLIALLTISSQFFVRSMLSNQATDSRIINIAGRQRMLSQLLTKNALILSLENTESSFRSRQKKLSETLNTWQNSHKSLLAGNDRLGIPSEQNSKEIISLFKELQPFYENISKASEGLLLASRSDSLHIRTSLNSILDIEEQYLSRMDAIVFLYDKEATEKVESLKSIELILMFATLIVLVLEAFLIFMPVIRKGRFALQELRNKNTELATEQKAVAMQSNEIYAQNEELHQQSEQLVLANESLSQQKEELEANLNMIEGLQAELSKLAVVVNHTDNAVIITNQEGCIEFVNKGFERVTEYTLAECKGKKPGHFLQGLHTNPDTIEYMREKLREQVPFTTEVLNYSKTGREYWLLLTINPLFDLQGKLINFVAIETDISEQKRKESLLEQQKKELNELLEKLKETQIQLVQSEKLSSLGLLAAGIAHEVNNPINFILAGAHALKEAMADIKRLLEMYENMPLERNELEERIEKIAIFKKEIFYTDLEEEVGLLVADILTGAERTEQIVSSLRTFSKLDGENIAPADIHENLDSTLLMVQNQFQDRVQLIKDYDSHYSTVECDVRQINQAVMNILVNAYQAIEGKGIITLKTRFDKKQAVISISDNGNGIAEENLPRLFEPFYTTKDVGEGTGLGLSVCHGIMKNHNGRIEVHSQIGMGSTFKLILPLSSLKETLL
ncbi:MAG: PAS domain S-box-containing protein [Flammeovirgaceae bacterium]|jgi:PAS domain S-box-containing protein